MRPVDGASHPRAEICVYWFHPLLLSEFQRLVPPGDLRVRNQRIEPYAEPELEKLSVTRASLSVVETHPRQGVTEALVAAITRQLPGDRILVLAEHFSEENAFPLLHLGVKGLLTYAEMPSHLSRALAVGVSGGFWVPRDLLSAFLDTVRSGAPSRPPPATRQKLTERERDVLENLLQNRANKEIAKKLQISERTTKFHVSNLLAKFGVRRRADLILLSIAPGTER